MIFDAFDILQEKYRSSISKLERNSRKIVIIKRDMLSTLRVSYTGLFWKLA